jgi:hypothetical protein
MLARNFGTYLMMMLLYCSSIKVETFLLSYNNNSSIMLIAVVSLLHAYLEVKYIFTRVLPV